MFNVTLKYKLTHIDNNYVNRYYLPISSIIYTIYLPYIYLRPNSHSAAVQAFSFNIRKKLTCFQT